MTDSLPRPRAVLMGPQRLAPMVDRALELLDIAGDGRVAVVTAGWQEREDEDGELMAALGGRPGVNLRLHARGDAVYREDEQLFVEHRARQDRLKDVQALYRRRLSHAMSAAIEMQGLQASGRYARVDEDDREDGGDEGVNEGPHDREIVAAQLRGAIDWVRQLDDEHVRLTAAIDERFVREFTPLSRPAVARQRAEILAALAPCSAVAIAGGHVAVLLNKLVLFGLAEALADKPIVAWSAGAMALTERVVLFHDTPPQGRGYAEVLGLGLGLMPDVVALPHARRRLLLADTGRISLFARRFLPRHCVALDERCYISYYLGDLGRGMWRANEHTRYMRSDGACVTMGASATQAGAADSADAAVDAAVDAAADAVDTDGGGS